MACGAPIATWPFRGVEGDVDLTLGILSAFFDGYLLIAEPE